MQDHLFEAVKEQCSIVEVYNDLTGNSIAHGKPEVKIHCPLPDHEDNDPSASIDVKKEAWYCFVCDKGGSVVDMVKDVKRISKLEAAKWLADKYHVDTNETGPIKKSHHNKAKTKAKYTYKDQNGKPLHRTVRTADKDFYQQRYVDDSWEWKLNGIQTILYRLKEVKRAIKNDRFIYLVEGEKDVDNLHRQGLIATCNAMGAGKWQDSYTKTLRGAKVIILPDNDVEGKKHARYVATQLHDKAKLVKLLELPDLPAKGDVSDWLIAGGTRDKLRKLVKECKVYEPDNSEHSQLSEKQEVEPRSIEQAKEVFHKWLEIEDDTFIDAVLGAHLTTRMSKEDPVWLFLIAPPGSGKTELLRTLRTEKDVYTTSSITDKTLVSGAKGDVSLAPKLNDKTFIIKDFSPILSLKYEKKNAIFSDLRDCYDGYIEKKFGNREEKKSYETHFSLLAGATPAIDKYSSVQAQLGERFLKLRIDIGKRDTKEEIIKAAMANVSSQAKMREELAEAVRGVLANVDTSFEPEFSDDIKHKIVKMTQFLSQLRTGVDRDRYDKTLNYLPEAESGARPVGQLKKLAIGICWLRGLEEPDDDVLHVLRKITVGGISRKRAKVLFAINNKTKRVSTPEIVKKTGIPKTTTKQVTDDLEVLEVVNKEKIEDKRGQPYGWSLNEDIKEFIEEAGLSYELGGFKFEKEK